MEYGKIIYGKNEASTFDNIVDQQFDVKQLISHCLVDASFFKLKALTFLSARYFK